MINAQALTNGAANLVILLRHGAGPYRELRSGFARSGPAYL
jgi:hypothetical protein